MRRAACIVCLMLAVPTIGVAQPMPASEPKSEVPPSYRLCVLRLTLDGMVVVRQQSASYRLRQTPRSDGAGAAYYYEPCYYDVDNVVKLADLSDQDGGWLDGGRNDASQARLSRPTVAVAWRCRRPSIRTITGTRKTRHALVDSRNAPPCTCGSILRRASLAALCTSKPLGRKRPRELDRHPFPR